MCLTIRRSRYAPQRAFDPTGMKEKREMLYYCQYTWFPHTKYEDVAKRIIEEHDQGANFPERLRGWYALAGGGAGFVLADFDDPRELTRFLQPYMDLMSFDVRAIYEFSYDTEIEHLRQVTMAALT